MVRYRITIMGELKCFQVVDETDKIIKYKDDKSFTQKIEQKISDYYFWSDTKEQCKEYAIKHWEGKMSQLNNRNKEILEIINKITNL
jgi:hypothetical protein